MKIVNVIPLKKGILKGNLTYFTTKEIESGSIVTINLRGKRTLGLAVSSENVSNTKIDIKEMNFNLKKIIEVKEKSIFRKEYIESVIHASEYFVSGKSNSITSMIPASFREEYDAIALGFKKFKPSSHATSAPKNLRSEKMLLQESFENRISIYKTLIRENFASHKSVFIVLPTEKDIENLEEHLSKGIGQFIYTFHGGFTQKKALEKLIGAMATEHPVLLLGTAPFLSVPRADIGAIIVEHESSSSYKMIAPPRFDLRVFAEIFAEKINAKFILSDNLLRFETIARREIDGLLPMHPLSFRIDFDGEIEIESREAKEAREGKSQPFKIFREASRKEIENAVLNKKNTFIFTLRKGLATQTLCGDCGQTVSCEKCLAPLVLYNSNAKKKRFFVCNRCGDEKTVDTVCTHCQSWNLVPLGIGTDTVVEEISMFLPEAKIFKLDKESVKSKKEAEKIAKEWEETKGAILVGTEMALHYMKNKVALSIIASFDSFWSIPNFKMSEKIIQLAVSILSKTKDKFIIQTKNAKDSVVLAVQSKNLLPFVRSELEDRRNLSYPPFMRFIKIKHAGNKAETLKAAKIISETLEGYKPLIFSGFSAQVKTKYITNALIKIKTTEWSYLSKIDKNLLAKLQALPPSFEIFVDPEDLL
ncbi:MAG TPA: hypothetical protein VGO63_03865 [Candidatus Paceibacterota bacterium]|jgi:primosomal protein N' (replication factor Y)|nr:hypothetical protein [Candidatus Paceibacterota bacterium]